MNDRSYNERKTNRMNKAGRQKSQNAGGRGVRREEGYGGKRGTEERGVRREEGYGWESDSPKERDEGRRRNKRTSRRWLLTPVC